MKIIKANNFIESEIGVIKQLNANSLHDKYIIITPDRYSLTLEKNIFDILGIKSTFNISVMGISRFAYKILSRQGKNVHMLSSLGTLMLTRLAISHVQSKLKCFTNITLGVSEEIKNTIAQLKSSKISFLEKPEIKNPSLKQKIDDIFLIYEEYEKLLDGRLDASALLDTLEEALDAADLSSHTICFVGFDSLTAQGGQILAHVSRLAKETIVGVVLPALQANAYVYETDLYDKATKLGFGSVVEFPCQLTPEQKHIVENLFAYKKSTLETDRVEIFASSDPEGEVLDVARKIKELIFNGARFNEIAVACSELEKYKQIIEKIFSEHNYSYFIDSSVSMNNLMPIKFIFCILNLIINNFKKNDLIEYLNYRYVKLENKNELISEIIKFDINENIEFIENNLPEIFDIYKKYQKKLNNYDLFFDIFEKFNLKEEILLQAQEFHDKNDLVLEKTFIQIPDKIDAAIAQLQDFNIEEPLVEFKKLLEVAFDAQLISVAPASVDSVFVGDVTNSFFSGAKFLFVVGAAEGALPRYISDCGVITDGEIAELKFSNSIEPTIKMINRRNRFKVLSTLSAFTEKLYVFYPESSAGGKKTVPSVVVRDISEMFSYCGKPLKTQKVLHSALELSEKEQCEMLARLAIDENSDFSVEHGFSPSVIGTYNSFKKEEKEVLEEKANLISGSKLNVTELETFFACPFKRFCTYNLKLREPDEALIQPNDIGNFVHAYLEKAIFDLENIDVQKETAELFKEEKFYKFSLKKNRAIKKIIIKEISKLTEFLKKSQKNTNFIPYLTEKKVNLVLQTPIGAVTLGGVIDRIDTFDKYFRIIDYKTGSKKLGGYQELYYGEKLQLFLYLKFAEKELGLIPAGAFYFPIRNNEESYKLSGYYIGDPVVLNALDTSLSFDNPSSEFVNLRMKINKENRRDGVVEYYDTYLTSETLGNMENYAEELTLFALSEISEGNKDKNPCEGACDFCPFGALCKVSKWTEPRTHEYKIDKNFFKELKTCRTKE